MTTARLSCQVCYQTMYSWNSRNVPIFTLMHGSEDKTLDAQP